MHWIFVSPQISYGEALTLNVVVLGGRAFEKYLGLCELKSGISVLIGKETRALSHLPLPLLSLSLALSLSALQGHKREGSHLKSGREP